MTLFSSISYNKELFLTARLKKILNDLYNDIQNRKTLVMVLGEKGVGKSTLLWNFKDILVNENHSVSYLHHAISTAREALNKICTDLGLEIEDQQEPKEQLRELSRLARANSRQGRNSVLIVDDIFLFKQEVADQLQTILETVNTDGSNLQMILATDQTSFQQIEKPKFQFIQYYLERVHYLYPLNKPEIQEYLFYKLGFIDARLDRIPFIHSRVVGKVWSATRGNFYLISVLAEQIEKSMQRQNKTHLSGKVIKQTLKDTYRNQPDVLHKTSTIRRIAFVLFYSLTTALIILLIVFFLQPAILGTEYFKNEKHSSSNSVKRSISFHSNSRKKSPDTDSKNLTDKNSRRGQMSDLSFIPPSRIKMTNSTGNNSLYAVIVGAAQEQEPARNLSRYLQKKDITSCLLELKDRNGKKLFIVEIGITNSKDSAQIIASSYTRKMQLEATLRALDRTTVRKHMYCP